MKTLKVGIASYADMKARTLAIARGEIKPAPGDPRVWFTSPESFAKVLSNKNRDLLALIRDERPQSLVELAEATGRTAGNRSCTLQTMERYGLVRLNRGPRGTLRAEVPFRSVQLQVELARI